MTLTDILQAWPDPRYAEACGLQQRRRADVVLRGDEGPKELDARAAAAAGTLTRASAWACVPLSYRGWRRRAPDARQALAGALEAFVAPPPRYYDYDRQAWVVGGVVAPCGHVAKALGCYACEHAGERV